MNNFTIYTSTESSSRYQMSIQQDAKKNKQKQKPASCKAWRVFYCPTKTGNPEQFMGHPF